MPGPYPTTTTPFTCWERADLAQMATALSSAPVHDGAALYRDVADTIDRATTCLLGAATALRARQVGAAADAVDAHFELVRATGMSGQSQALEAMLALVDEGETVSAARNRIAEAGEFADADVPRGATLNPRWEAAYVERLQRVQEAAAAYENLTNTQYVAAFQPYEPPPSPAVDTSAAPAGGGVGGVGTVPAGIATAPAGATAPAPGGAAQPAVPGGSTGGAPPAGEAGTGTAVAPGAVAPRSGPAVPPARSAPRGPVPDGSPPWPATRAPSRDGRVDAPPPGPVTGWRPGQPWNPSGGQPSPGGTSGGRTPGGAGGGRPPAIDGGAPGPRPGPPSAAAPAGPGPAPAGARPGVGYGGFPMAGAGLGGQGAVERARPAWLLQDDPESIWFAGMPDHCDPVIGGEPPGR